MNYEKEKEIKIQIMEVIRWAEEEYGFELDASKEVEMSNMIFDKLETSSK